MLGEIRTTYDAQVRQKRQGEDPAFLWQTDGDVFRVVGPGSNEHENAVLYSDCNADTADKTIARQVAYFQERRKAFEWKLYDYDRPEDLAVRLLHAGFQPAEEETLMVFPLARSFHAHPLPDGYAVEEIVNPERFVEIAALREEVYGSDDAEKGEWLARTLADEYRADPSALRMFFLRAHDRLASAAWLRLPPDCPFAGLWGGMTHPAHEGKGCYTALVAARLQVARDAGYRYMTVDCRPTSRPILERRGFDALATVTPFVWAP